MQFRRHARARKRGPSGSIALPAVSVPSQVGPFSPWSVRNTALECSTRYGDASRGQVCAHTCVQESALCVCMCVCLCVCVRVSWAHAIEPRAYTRATAPCGVGLFHCTLPPKTSTTRDRVRSSGITHSVSDIYCVYGNVSIVCVFYV